MTSKVRSSDSSKCFEDVESEDLTLDTSIYSDQTLSADDSDGRRQDKKRRIVKKLAQRKQLIHDMHLLKVELQQKNLVIEGLKSEHAQHIDHLEDRLNGLTYQKQVLQARLDAELQGVREQDEVKRQQRTISKEVELLKAKQQHLEAVNEKLLEKAGQVRHSLIDLSLSPDQYCKLKGVPSDELSLQDYIAVRIYDRISPLQTEIDHLRMVERAQDKQLAASAAEVTQLKERLEEEHATNAELLEKLQEASCSPAENTTRPDTVCCTIVSATEEDHTKFSPERTLAQREQFELNQQLNSMETAVDNLKKERDELAAQLSTTRQSEALLMKDKEYLSRQVAESTRRADLAEDRLQQATRHLDDARMTREEVYEKYITCRDRYKTEYDKKLQTEVDQLRASTTTEMEQLRTATKNMYERENRALREARDAALAERARFQASAKEMNLRCEELTTQLREERIRAEREVSDLQNEVKVKSLQAERCQMVQEETQSHLKDRAMEVELLQKKAQVMEKEYHSLQTALEKRVAELETRLLEKNSKVDMYERLEQELDSIIIQAADTTSEEAAEKVLSPYASAPTSTKRRLQQSIQLAKKVLQLEKDNSALRRHVEEERNKITKLTEELEKSQALLGRAQQPQRYLLTSIQEREELVTHLQDHIHLLEQDLRQTEQEKQRLKESSSKMSHELQRLHHQTKDMGMLKQAVSALTARQRSQLRPSGPGQSQRQVVSVRVPRADSVRSATPSSTHTDFAAVSRTSSDRRPSPQARKWIGGVEDQQPPWKKTTKKKVVQSQKRGPPKYVNSWIR